MQDTDIALRTAQVNKTFFRKRNWNLFKVWDDHVQDPTSEPKSQLFFDVVESLTDDTMAKLDVKEVEMRSKDPGIIGFRSLKYWVVRNAIERDLKQTFEKFVDKSYLETAIGESCLVQAITNSKVWAISEILDRQPTAMIVAEHVGSTFLTELAQKHLEKYTDLIQEIALIPIKLQKV
jgi:hypothetical protein